MQLEWWGIYVSKEDSECWLILFAQVYRMFSQVLENKNLFQILALTGSAIEGALLSNFNLTGS